MMSSNSSSSAPRAPFGRLSNDLTNREPPQSSKKKQASENGVLSTVLMRSGSGDIDSRLSSMNLGGEKDAVAKLDVETIVEEKELSPEELMDTLDKIFDQQASAKMLKVPRIMMPSQIKTELLKHQIDGVRYLVNQEKTGGPEPPYFEQINTSHGTRWRCKLTNSRRDDEPKRIFGGILADDMGLGKTLQIIATIVANPPQGVVFSDKIQGIKRRSKPKDGGPSCTLIVCPVSVVANWYQQIEQHVQTGVLRIATYEGPNRSELIPKIRDNKIDVLFTSYQTLSSELKKVEKAREEAAQRDQDAIEQARAQASEFEDGDDDNEDDSSSEQSIQSRPDRRAKIRKDYNLSDSDDESSYGSDEEYDDEPSNESDEEYDDEEYDDVESDGEYDSEEPESIFDVAFYRIVLDEAHHVRNSDTGLYKAAAAIDASKKICLTGTPFFNHPNDIHSLFAFLGLEPLNDLEVFTDKITNCIEAGRSVGLARLRTAMGYATLRRTKHATQLDMVEKSTKIIKVKFPEASQNAHKEIHDAIFYSTQAAVDAALGAKLHFAAMLEMVMRVRQACCAGDLIPQKRINLALDAVKDAEAEGRKLTSTEGLQILETTKNFLRKNRNNEESDEEDAFDHEDDEEESREPLETAPKIVVLLKLIDQMNAQEKGVIFCAFTRHLDLIQIALHENGHSYTRIDGTMNAEKRLEAMNAFNKEDVYSSPRLIMCSLMACGTGINLTRGNCAFLMSPWWNSAAENQAMDRVHRLGQTRPVRVYKLIMADSIEERMLTIQKAKASVGKGSMQKLSKKEEQRVKITAMKDLFQIGEHDQMYDSDEDLDDFIVDSDSEE